MKYSKLSFTPLCSFLKWHSRRSQIPTRLSSRALGGTDTHTRVVPNTKWLSDFSCFRSYPPPPSPLVHVFRSVCCFALPFAFHVCLVLKMFFSSTGLTNFLFYLLFYFRCNFTCLNARALSETYMRLYHKERRCNVFSHSFKVLHKQGTTQCFKNSQDSVPSTGRTMLLP